MTGRGFGLRVWIQGTWSQGLGFLRIWGLGYTWLRVWRAALSLGLKVYDPLS